MSDARSRHELLSGDARAHLMRAVANHATPDYVTVRALTALGDDDDTRLARLTGMGRQFVVDVRTRVRTSAVALLAGAPVVHERVLEAATQQLTETAPHAFEMKRVADDTSIPRRTLYNLYASGDLIDACCRRAQTIWRARFRLDVLAVEPRARRLPYVVEAIDRWVGSDGFRRDQALRAHATFAADVRDDPLREHLAEIDRFATQLAADVSLASPRDFGALVANSVAGAAAWYDRRAASRAVAAALVERLMVRGRRGV